MRTLPLDRLPERSAPALDLLSGIKVLDLTSSVAGPYAGQLLADMGAEVIKIEKPVAGDDARAWGPPFLHGQSLWFMSVNRGKQSVTLDFSTPEGLVLLHGLVAQADVILLNLVARAQKKLRIDSATLQAIKPALVHVSITGFGLQGERADMPCYDLIAEGYSGVMDLTGELAQGPQKVGTPAADMLAGHDAAMAVLAALLRRTRSGQGCAIDIAMVQSMSRFMAPRLMPHLGSGEVYRRSGGRDSVIAHQPSRAGSNRVAPPADTRPRRVNPSSPARPASRPAVKPSPQPVVSTTSAGSAGRASGGPPPGQATRQPSAPGDAPSWMRSTQPSAFENAWSPVATTSVPPSTGT